MIVTLKPSNAVLEVGAGEPILEAARRLGYDCPQSCRNGNCHICAAVLVEGQVQQQGTLIEQGELYTCLASPVGDCVLHWDGVLAPGELPAREVSCQLIECAALGGDVYRLKLRVPAGKALRYYAGQYLLLQRAADDWAAFSLASAPHQGRDLELHILARDEATLQFLVDVQARGSVRAQLPFGDTHLADLPDGPLILLAAGTGMAQMQSLLEHCRAQGFSHPIHLYWGAREPEDFYLIEPWAQWQQLDNLLLHKVVSDSADWSGRCGLLHQAVCEDFADLKPLHVYASGSPAMVYGTLDALVAAGMDAHQMRADVFAYAPRS